MCTSCVLIDSLVGSELVYLLPEVSLCSPCIPVLTFVILCGDWLWSELWFWEGCLLKEVFTTISYQMPIQDFGYCKSGLLAGIGLEVYLMVPCSISSVSCCFLTESLYLDDWKKIS